MNTDVLVDELLWGLPNTRDETELCDHVTAKLQEWLVYQRRVMLNELLTVVEVADQLEISTQRVRAKTKRLHELGLPVGRKVSGGGWVYLPEDVEYIGKNIR